MKKKMKKKNKQKKRKLILVRKKKNEKKFVIRSLYVCQECGCLLLEPLADYIKDFQLRLSYEEFKFLMREWRRFLRFQEYIKEIWKRKKIKNTKKEYDDPQKQAKFELFKEIVEKGGKIITANPDLWPELWKK
jgi:ATP-dependent RNA circularization protein (DNA/RNA ligase family)